MLSTVNTSRGSDMYLQTIETRTYMESTLVSSEKSEEHVEHESKEESEIIYYPTEDDTSEVARYRCIFIRCPGANDENFVLEFSLKPADFWI